MKKPNLQAVRKQFSNAKSVTCLTNAITIDVTGITEFEYDQEAEIWTSIGGAITFWKNGQFAAIVTTVYKKPCACENCDCNKGKTVKRIRRKL
jgi:hypothetical protein